MSADFSWEDSESVVVRPVLGIAVYYNEAGNVVIRLQTDGTLGDDDDCVVIPLAHARKVADAIKALVADAEGGK